MQWGGRCLPRGREPRHLATPTPTPLARAPRALTLGSLITQVVGLGWVSWQPSSGGRMGGPQGDIHSGLGPLRNLAGVSRALSWRAGPTGLGLHCRCRLSIREITAAPTSAGARVWEGGSGPHCREQCRPRSSGRVPGRPAPPPRAIATTLLCFLPALSPQGHPHSPPRQPLQGPGSPGFWAQNSCSDS